LHKIDIPCEIHFNIDAKSVPQIFYFTAGRHTAGLRRGLRALREFVETLETMVFCQDFAGFMRRWTNFRKICSI
jgi:hypothetical protein